jgi:type IV secretory pathway TraG/TraD family ATPase VirD4
MTSTRARGTSPATDRDIRLLALGLAALTLLTAVTAVLMLAVAVASWAGGSPAAVPPPGRWLAQLGALLSDPGDPGPGLGDPWTQALTGRGWLYWLVAGLLFTVITVPVVGLCRRLWRSYAPTPPGHATRADIREELSAEAARRTAAWTRPALSAEQVRRAHPRELAAPCHLGPGGPMWLPWENPSGTIAPTQSGKTRRDLVHKAIDAPGALLCSTTKTDLFEFAALARTRRATCQGRPGPVLVYDATGTVSWPAQLRWSPITGCQDPAVAYRRARAMVEASAVAVEAGGGAGAGNDRVFRERAAMVFGAYLLAAALGGRTVSDLVRWATTRPLSSEPADLIEHIYPQLAANLRAESAMVARTADAVWMSVRRVIEPLMNPTLLRLCSPGPGEGFDAEAFIRAGGSLFLIAGQHQAAQVAPLLTALVDHWLTTAQDMALSYPSRRLDPPATAVLDELPNATPLPQLPDIVSDSAGRGVIIHWAAQSVAQLEDTYGQARARQLLDNTTTLSAWGSLKDPQALEWLSTLAGHHDQQRWQDHNEGLLGPSRSTIGTETVPTYRPGDIRGLGRGRVLLIHRHLRPIEARATDVSARPDWPQLRADTEAVRAGRLHVSPTGHTTPGGS